MINILLVGTGGFIGSVCRYLLGGAVQRMLHTLRFPYGTLAVNVIGCFLIGFVYGLGNSKQFFSTEARLFLATGFLGGFTTFSSFGYETFALATDVHITAALGNVALQVIIGLTAVWLGNAVSRLY